MDVKDCFLTPFLISFFCASQGRFEALLSCLISRWALTGWLADLAVWRLPITRLDLVGAGRFNCGFKLIAGFYWLELCGRWICATDLLVDLSGAGRSAGFYPIVEKRQRLKLCFHYFPPFLWRYVFFLCFLRAFLYLFFCNGLSINDFKTNDL